MPRCLRKFLLNHVNKFRNLEKTFLYENLKLISNRIHFRSYTLLWYKICKPTIVSHREIFQCLVFGIPQLYVYTSIINYNLQEM